jgi:hypothetical protein
MHKEVALEIISPYLNVLECNLSDIKSQVTWISEEEGHEGFLSDNYFGFRSTRKWESQ